MDKKLVLLGDGAKHISYLLSAEFKDALTLEIVSIWTYWFFYDNDLFELANLIASGDGFTNEKYCEDTPLKPTFASLLARKQLSLCIPYEDFDAGKVHNIIYFVY